MLTTEKAQLEEELNIRTVDDATKLKADFDLLHLELSDHGYDSHNSIGDTHTLIGASGFAPIVDGVFS